MSPRRSRRLVVLAPEAERAVGLGATRLADGPTWITLADPAGQPFELCQAEASAP
jgi:hypothetical protein